MFWELLRNLFPSLVQGLGQILKDLFLARTFENKGKLEAEVQIKNVVIEAQKDELQEIAKNQVYKNSINNLSPDELNKLLGINEQDIPPK